MPSSERSDDLTDLLAGLQPSDVEFLDLLKQDKDRGSTVYKVKIHDKFYVMKIFKGQPDLQMFDPDYESRLFLREYEAYRLLKEKGFCARGVVPDFYGAIEKINVERWPTLYEFEDDPLPPDAIFLEYIPDMKRLGIENFSADNLSRFSQTLREFHEMGLLHGDSFPRNMMVVQQQPRDRVLWTDFDCAQIVQPGKCKEWTEKKFDLERRMMDYLETGLAEDAKNGEIKVTWNYYYDH